MGSLSLLQWIFPTQELNQGLLHCSQILYQLSYQGSTKVSYYFVMGFPDGSDSKLIAQLVKNLPAMQETPVQFLGWEDPLEKG